MTYKLSDAEFKEALRKAVIEHTARPDGPYAGKLPEDFKPFHPLWYTNDNVEITVDRGRTLLLGPYSYIPAEQRAALLEKV